jgi:F0F1-type ATP synthase assembly protein I
MSESNDFRQGLNIAFRLGTEMTVATLLGAGMGYGVDYYFETKPWGIVVGVVFGGAAGMLNVYRAAQAMTEEQASTEEQVSTEDKNKRDQNQNNTSSKDQDGNS